MRYGVSLYDAGKWTITAEGREAEALISSIGVIPVLEVLSSGESLPLVDFRAVVGREGQVICLNATESAAVAFANQRHGCRIVPAKIGPVPMSDVGDLSDRVLTS